MQGGPSTSWRTGLYARRSKHVMEDRPVCKEVQARHGRPACMQGADKRLPATGKQLMRRRSSVDGVDTTHEEEEQCRRSRHSS